MESCASVALKLESSGIAEEPFSLSTHKSHQKHNIYALTQNLNFIYYVCAMTEQELTHQIIGAAIEVHKLLGGPGLIESVYESALSHELTLRGLLNQRQIAIPVLY